MVSPRNASTVVLLRPGDAGELRNSVDPPAEEMRFLGGYYVFPGGTVHRDDYSPRVLARCRGLAGGGRARFSAASQKPEEALGHWVAVVRELFEEVGILLCVDDSGELIDFERCTKQATDSSASVKRSCGNSRTSARFSIGKSLLRFVAVVYFDHWVTPEIYSMRFDTRFYSPSCRPIKSH